MYNKRCDVTMLRTDMTPVPYFLHNVHPSFFTMYEPMIYTHPDKTNLQCNTNTNPIGAAHSPGFGPILFHNPTGGDHGKGVMKVAGGSSAAGMRSLSRSMGTPIPGDIPMLPQAALSPSSPNLSTGQSSSRSSSRGIRQGGSLSPR